MNGYVIADAINKFTREYKILANEKNKIEKDKLNFEKEKLAFEKEKFEFNKQQLELMELSKPLKDSSSNLNNEFLCPHHWVYDSVSDCPSDFKRKERYICDVTDVLIKQMVGLKKLCLTIK